MVVNYHLIPTGTSRGIAVQSVVIVFAKYAKGLSMILCICALVVVNKIYSFSGHAFPFKDIFLSGQVMLCHHGGVCPISGKW